MTTTSLNGFSDPVTLSIAGLPAGVTPSWDLNPASPPATQALTLSTIKTTPPGSYDLYISPTDGTLTHTIGITPVVNALPDLSVTSITFDPDPAVSWQLFTLSSQISNQGPGPAQAFRVTWNIKPLGQVDTVLSGSWDVDSLGFGNSKTLSVTLA